MQTFEKIVDFIKTHFEVEEQIPLHQPVFVGNERKYINECINSTFVSSVGRYVSEFENKFADFVGSRHAIATVNVKFYFEGPFTVFSNLDCVLRSTMKSRHWLKITTVKRNNP